MGEAGPGPASKGRSGQAPPWGLSGGLLPSEPPGPCEQVQEGGASSQGLQSRTRRRRHRRGDKNRVKGRPLQGAGVPAGCAARRPCRAASASQAPRRPQASRCRGAPGLQPFQRPGCRPPGPGRRTAASPRLFHSEKAHRTSLGVAFPTSMPARTASAPSTSPACLSRRASWIVRVALGSAAPSPLRTSPRRAGRPAHPGCAGAAPSPCPSSVRESPMLPWSSCTSLCCARLSSSAPVCGQRRRADSGEEPTLCVEWIVIEAGDPAVSARTSKPGVAAATDPSATSR